MDLRAGSLLRADGGFLIMYSLEALSEVGVWRALKRTLNHNRLEIQPLEMFYPFGGSAQKPEAIDVSRNYLEFHWLGAILARQIMHPVSGARR